MNGKRTLLLENLTKYDHVIKFLDSKARNSPSTARTYRIGLAHFETFLHLKNKGTLETILKPLLSNETDVYDLLDDFVNYLVNRKISENSTENYMAATKNYLEYYDIDILPKRFKRRVNLPIPYKRNEEPIDSQDIRTILQACNNERLKTFLMVLACCGCRTKEALGLRVRDINFNESPTKIHIRAEFSKTRQERDIWITKEASEQIKKYLVQKNFAQPDSLIFCKPNNENVLGVYTRLLTNFAELLKGISMDTRKDGKGLQRRKISFTSFRSYVKSIVSVQVNTDFSEWFLGHSGSTYWRFKEQDKKELWLKCEKYLTFLDYPTVQSVGQDYESKLKERDKEVEKLHKEIEDIKETQRTATAKLMQALKKSTKPIKSK